MVCTPEDIKKAWSIVARLDKDGLTASADSLRRVIEALESCRAAKDFNENHIRGYD